MNSSKVFAIRFITSFLLFGLIFSIIYLIFLKVGEVDIKYVVQRQLTPSNGKIIFLSGINQQAFPYKIEMLRQINPEVVVVGSSRSMQVRSEFFSKTFLNMGGAVLGVTDLENTVKVINSMSRPPNLAIIFFDPWWVSSKVDSRGGAHQPPYPAMISFELIYKGLEILSRGDWLLSPNFPNYLGIRAKITGDGFGGDGSYHYASLISGEMRSADMQFVETLNLIDAHASHFKPDKLASLQLIDRACKSIKALKKVSHNVSVILPPFPGVVFDKLNSVEYGYMKDGIERLSLCLGKEIVFREFLSAKKIFGASDCEFIDGTHGGDVIYARLLEDLYTFAPAISSAFNTGYVSSFIKTNAGYADGSYRTLDNKRKEGDFLNLGCTK
jgi:hypothetical protein